MRGRGLAVVIGLGGVTLWLRARRWHDESARMVATLRARVEGCGSMRGAVWGLVPGRRNHGVTRIQIRRARPERLRLRPRTVLRRGTQPPVARPWEARSRTFGLHQGVTVATAAVAEWQLPEGPFVYWRGRPVRADYRVSGDQ